MLFAYLMPERKLGFFVKIKEDENFNHRNTGVHPEMVDFGFRQGPSEFSTGGIACYFED